jgi:hypothetical protein
MLEARVTLSTCGSAHEQGALSMDRCLDFLRAELVQESLVGILLRVCVDNFAGTAV